MSTHELLLNALNAEKRVFQKFMFSLRPVTVHQALQAVPQPVDDKRTLFLLDNCQLGMVELVVHVCGFGQRGERAKFFSFEDGSRGTIKGVFWKMEEAEKAAEKYRKEVVADENELQGKYVRVVGRLNRFFEKTQIDIIKIKAVEDPHEVFFHILRCIEATHCWEEEAEKFKLTNRLYTMEDLSQRTQDMHISPPAEHSAPHDGNQTQMINEHLEATEQSAELSKGVDKGKEKDEATFPGEDYTLYETELDFPDQSLEDGVELDEILKADYSSPKERVENLNIKRDNESDSGTVVPNISKPKFHKASTVTAHNSPLLHRNKSRETLVSSISTDSLGTNSTRARSLRRPRVDPLSHLSNFERKIYLYILESGRGINPSDDVGVKEEDLRRFAKSQSSGANCESVSSALVALEDDGRIYKMCDNTYGVIV